MAQQDKTDHVYKVLQSAKVDLQRFMPIYEGCELSGLKLFNLNGRTVH